MRLCISPRFLFGPPWRKRWSRGRPRTGFHPIQFLSAVLLALPEAIDPELAAQIGREIRRRKLAVAAVSGTFNMIHPDRARRLNGLRRLEVLAANCAALGAPLITLCTGTRDAENMWRHHPDNDSPEAWSDLLDSLAVAAPLAERYNLFLGIEPETANVVSSAKKARRLLDEMKSPRLKIVMDAANFFHPGETRPREDVLNEAFDLLGGDILLAHGKDFRDAGQVEFVAPGQGVCPGRILSVCCAPAATRDRSSCRAWRKRTWTPAPPSSAGRWQSRPAGPPADLRRIFHDGIHFHYQDAGRGVPFFYQHGLGGDVNQTFEIFKPPAGFRLIGFDCRGHGQTRPVVPRRKSASPPSPMICGR